MKIAITGASGFVGTALINYLNTVPSLTILSLGRNNQINTDEHIEFDLISLDQNAPDFHTRLKGVSCLVHLAALTQIAGVTSATDTELDKSNVAATSFLFKAASAANIKKFIFLSSIKVNGECTVDGQKFSSRSALNPQTKYASSKARAEIELTSLSKSSPTQLIILRPPLIYGEGAKGSFGKMLSLLSNQMPLPYVNSPNARSILSIYNLIDVISLCIFREDLGSQTFAICDDIDHTSASMIRITKSAIDSKSALIPVPKLATKIILSTLGKKNVYERLVSSLQIDNSLAKTTLNWKPRFDIHKTLATINEVTHHD
jgi:UDP-glucose 4-epimerase